MQELHGTLRVCLLAPPQLYLHLHLLTLLQEPLRLLKLAVKIGLADLKSQLDGFNGRSPNFPKE